MAAIEGRVRTRSGEPIGDVPVTIVDSDQPHPDLAALTDSEGAFRLSDLRPGWYRVQAEGEYSEIILTDDSEVAEVILEASRRQPGRTET